MKFGILALLAVGAAGIAGCEVGVTPPSAAIEVDGGAPVVYDNYYEGGHYDGAFWVWHDGGGHYYRERREFHERRYNEHMHPTVHHEVEHHEAVHHEEEHHEEHR